MDRGTDARVADAEPPFEQRLRAEGAEQRDVHRGCHDPPNTEAAGEGSMNLTKQSLRARWVNRGTSRPSIHPIAWNRNSPKSISSILHNPVPVPLESPVSGTPHSPGPVELATPMDRYARLWMLSCHKLMFAVLL